MRAPAFCLDHVRRWAEQRIEQCRIDERNFVDAWPRSKGHGPPQALVEAWTERRTLQQLLDRLDEATGSTPHPHVCSFCGKTEREVKKMVAAQDRPAVICDECVGTCVAKMGNASQAPRPEQEKK